MLTFPIHTLVAKLVLAMITSRVSFGSTIIKHCNSMEVTKIFDPACQGDLLNEMSDLRELIIQLWGGWSGS